MDDNNTTTSEFAASGGSANPCGWTDDRISAVKRGINALVFEWGNEEMTLREAEEVACEMLTAILKKRRWRDSQNDQALRPATEGVRTRADAEPQVRSSAWVAELEAVLSAARRLRERAQAEKRHGAIGRLYAAVAQLEDVWNREPSRSATIVLDHQSKK